MSLPYRTRRRIASAIATACAGLVLASAAQAIDLRDWGRKFPASERFVVLAQFNNQAVLDKETQLVWQRYWGNNTVTQTTANRYCIWSNTGGRYGWRLPTITEYQTLMDPGVAPPVRLPVGHPFRTQDGQQIPLRVLWTSTFERRSPPGSYWYFTFQLNADTDFRGDHYSLHFVCVRGANTVNES